MAAKSERSRLDQRSDDATDTETPPLGSNASKSPEKTSAPLSPPDEKAANGTGTPADKNVGNYTAGPGNDSEKASGSSAKDGKPAEDDRDKLAKQLEKPSSDAELSRPEENASGVKPPGGPGNVDNESANPVVVDETLETPSTN